MITIKYHLYGTMALHKAGIVARRFTQAHDIDYIKTFHLVVHKNSICVLLSLIAAFLLSTLPLPLLYPLSHYPLPIMEHFRFLSIKWPWIWRILP